MHEIFFFLDIRGQPPIHQSGDLVEEVSISTYDKEKGAKPMQTWNKKGWTEYPATPFFDLRI